MNDTLKPTNEAKIGSKLLELEPWDIAVLSVLEEGNITVEFATNDQFQAYVKHNNIPYEDEGIAEWSFEDRCGIINFARLAGIILKPVPNKNNFFSELFTQSQPTPEAESLE